MDLERMIFHNAIIPYPIPNQYIYKVYNIWIKLWWEKRNSKELMQMDKKIKIKKSPNHNKQLTCHFCAHCSHSQRAPERKWERESGRDVRIISCRFVSGDLPLRWSLSHNHINNATWIKHGRQSLKVQWKHCTGFSKYFIFMSLCAFEVCSILITAFC